MCNIIGTTLTPTTRVTYSSAARWLDHTLPAYPLYAASNSVFFIQRSNVLSAIPVQRAFQPND